MIDDTITWSERVKMGCLDGLSGDVGVVGVGGCWIEGWEGRGEGKRDRSHFILAGCFALAWAWEWLAGNKYMNRYAKKCNSISWSWFLCRVN